MKAVVSVVGRDAVGIIAKVSKGCADCGVNILDISQTVLSDYFSMIMLTDIDSLKIPFADFADKLTELGQKKNLQIHTVHEDIFNSMHRI